MSLSQESCNSTDVSVEDNTINQGIHIWFNEHKSSTWIMCDLMNMLNYVAYINDI